MLLERIRRPISIDPGTGQPCVRWGAVVASVLVQLAGFTLAVRVLDWVWASHSPEHVRGSWLSVILWGCVLVGPYTALDVWRGRSALLRTSRRPRIEPQR